MDQRSHLGAGEAGLNGREGREGRMRERLVPVGHAAVVVGAVVRGQTIDIVQRQISQGQTALELEIFGPDVARLQTIADNVIAAISQIPGVGLPDKNVTNSQPEVNVTIDRAKLIMSGLGTGDLAQFVDTATSGTVASFYQVNGIQYPIIVELPPEPHRSLAASRAAIAVAKAGRSPGAARAGTVAADTEPPAPARAARAAT